MSRWIDAEWLEELFPDTGEGEWTYNATALGYIDSAPTIKTKQIKYYDENEKVWKIDEVIVSDSEKPNNCEHITEDGVTCARYPACDDCPDNPLNKVKGSERLVKGKDEPQKQKKWKCGGGAVEPIPFIYPQVDGITPSVIITEDRDTQVLDSWQVKLQTERSE